MLSQSPPNIEDSDPPTQPIASKKPRLQGACDTCKRKKIRCDSGRMPSNRCSNCIAFSLECTHTRATKSLGSARAYVANLENRLQKMEKLLKQLSPDLDLNQDASPDTDRATADEPDDLPRNDSDSETDSLSKGLIRIKLNSPERLYFGKSSTIMLVQAALDAKCGGIGDIKDIGEPLRRVKRPEYWSNLLPWQKSDSENNLPPLDFPDDDLMLTLLDIYFINVNPFLPLLHRPIFTRSIAGGLHYRDRMFGCTVLLVCAIASRYSDDPLVFPEGVDSPHSRGWKWYNQVTTAQRDFSDRPTLYQLQIYPLSVLYMLACPLSHGAWVEVGTGLRLAQDVGAHRHNPQQNGNDPQVELWKRAFWVLLCMDRFLSAYFGRPCAIQDEDFDLDLPIECDDEYWEHPDPGMAFKQPPDKPSIMTFFNCYLKLYDILAFTMRTVYSLKSKSRSSRAGRRSDQQAIAELDSLMNQWLDSVPDHLRWDPHRETSIFFHQSAMLFASYYNVQILIHRPFIPGPRHPATFFYPSLTICTNAARSCSRIVDIQNQRSVVPLPQMQFSAFTAGIVLLLNIWSGKRSGISSNSYHGLDDVHKCLRLLRNCEQRWHVAGRFWDILSGLASAGDLALSQPNSMRPKKRIRETDVSTTTQQAPIFAHVEQPHSFAGSNGGASRSFSTDPLIQEGTLHDQSQVFTPPVRSNELGVLPSDGPLDLLGSNGLKLENGEEWYSGLLPANVFNDIQMAGDLGSFPYTAGTNIDFFSASDASSPESQGQDHGNADISNVLKTPRTTPMDGGQGQNMPSHNAFGPLPIVADDILAMWSSAPTGFNSEDWGTYISNFNVDEMIHGQNHIQKQYEQYMPPSDYSVG